MDPVRTFAFGVDLQLARTDEGGRLTALPGGFDDPHFQYRPNWGLPGWEAGEQTAGPIFGFTHTDLSLGSTTRAVLVALFPDHVAGWAQVVEGDVLRMYEGSKVCGFASVRWAKQATWPATDVEVAAYRSWLAAG